MALPLATSIFVLDAFTSSDLAIAGLYVLVMLLALGGGKVEARSSIAGWTATCCVLAVFGFMIYDARGASPLAAAHLGINLVTILAAAALLLNTHAVRRAGRRMELRYERLFDNLSIAVWEYDFEAVERLLVDLPALPKDELRAWLLEHYSFVMQARSKVKITDVNATAMAMMGVATKTEFFANLDAFFAPTNESLVDCLVAIRERRPVFQAEARLMTLSGESIDVIVSFGLGPGAELRRVPASIVDISQRKRLEREKAAAREEMARAQRLGSIAALSAALSHELNQPLAAMRSYCDAARRWLRSAPANIEEAQAAMNGLDEAMSHSRDIVSHVKRLSLTRPLETDAIDLRELLSATTVLLRNDLQAADTRLDTPVPAGRVMVRADRVLLKQVLVNLAMNAIQAVAGMPKERRVVSLEVREIAGSRIGIRVVDGGPGWSPETRDAAFQPFFSTKETGMGLGLAVCRTIMERHGGSITLGDADGGGAMVDLELPAA